MSRKKKRSNRGKAAPVKPPTKFPKNEIAAKLDAALQGTQEDLKKATDSVPDQSIEDVMEEVDSQTEDSQMAKTVENADTLNDQEQSTIDHSKILKEINDARATSKKALRTAEAREKVAQMSEDKSKKTIEEYQKKLASLKSREDEILEKEQSLSKDEDEHLQALEELQHQKSDLLEKEERLITREADADAGFMARRTKMLSKLEDEMNSYAEKLASHGEKTEALRAKALTSIEQQRDELETSKEKIEKALAEKERELNRKIRESEWLLEDLKEEKSAWDDRLKQRVQESVQDIKDDLISSRQRVKELEIGLQKSEAAIRAVGNQNPTQMLRDIESLKNQNKQLNDELAQRPTLIDADINQQLQDRLNEYKLELDRVMKENQALQLREGKSAIGVAELENLRDQRASWEMREEALKANIEELKSDLGQYVEQSKNKEVFPECRQMDNDEKLQEAQDLQERDSIDLSKLVSFARNQIAHKDLYYKEKDLRAYLAGLATTRLHILQGISGTGKTSLPREFAKIMGWGFDLIEVQSGWRDRQDLLGYYNSFEHKFYESPFLQALYKAMTPRYKGVPFFIVLDEMNLSHPEHYFADFLSAIEQPKGEQSVPLLSSRLKGGDPPKLLLDEGKRISLPPNVWFIGTANQDETTKDFADKTYDRANVQEFPKQPDQFTPQNQQSSGNPLSIRSLQKSFDHAQKSYADSAKEAIDILKRELTSPLHNLGIGWGNRLEAQMKCYIPVLTDSGGSIGEGLDNLVAHKLLRKLKGRFDLSSESLASLDQQLTKIWDRNTSLKNTIPERCLEILETERKRLGNQD